MATLTVTAVLALAASCQNVVAPQTLLKIAQVETNLNPSARHQNRDGSWDLGLMQINSKNLEWLGLTDPFDPCQSIHAAAALLASYSRYNSGSPTASMEYAMAVWRQNRAVKDPAPSPPEMVAVLNDVPGDEQDVDVKLSAEK